MVPSSHEAILSFVTMSTLGDDRSMTAQSVRITTQLNAVIGVIGPTFTFGFRVFALKRKLQNFACRLI